MSEQKTLPRLVPTNINKSRELIHKGKAIYEQLKEQLEKEHWSKYVAIEPESGDYEVAKRAIDATMQLKERHPDKLLYRRRIGFLDKLRW